MAWNESRLWMVAPGYLPDVEWVPDPGIALIGFAKDPQSNAPPLDPFALAVFFKQHGLFRKDRAGTTFQANALEAILEECDPGEGICSIRLTFTIFDPLKKELLVPRHKTQWQEIVTGLSKTFAFRLLEPGSFQITDSLDLPQALRKTTACEGLNF